jgi:hypothetical protein
VYTYADDQREPPTNFSLTTAPRPALASIHSAAALLPALLVFFAAAAAAACVR